MALPAARRPLGARRVEQIGQRILAKALSRFGDRALGHQPPRRRRQAQIEARHHPIDGPVAEQRHAQDDPQHLNGRQPPLSQRRHARRRKRLLDLDRIDVTSELLERVRRNPNSREVQRALKSHAIASR